MAKSYTQDTRIARFTTPLGDAKLVLRQFHGTEAMSDLFEFRIEAIATERNLDFDKAIGKNCTVSMKTLEGGLRHFDGVLTEVRLVAEEEEGLVYSLVLRPWLWLLSKTRDSLIFHEMKAPDIIAKVFAKHGFARFEKALSRTYPDLEYCVQYRESDMDFVRRLMEKHGIGFHFRHEEGSHTLVMGDGSLAYQPVDGEKRPFIAIEKEHQRQKEHLFRWGGERRFTTGRVTVNDYDFKRPPANLVTEKTGDARYQNGKLEFYDYPGGYDEEAAGSSYAQWCLESARAADEHAFGEGDCVSCAPGNLMTLTGHPDKPQNKKYLVLQCAHSFLSQSYRSKMQVSGEGSYAGQYEFMDAARPYAPHALTARPYLRGPQTAVVVGEGEIDCDEHGRVLVHFFWDRKNDQSMRVRVAQVWASDKWGGIFIPRIGMEVLVDFLEGDPDKPIVIGCVYNGQNKPPYDLPGEKNIAGWKTNSTTGGGGYNEIAMDDTKGEELFRIHGQYDMQTVVEHDMETTVGNNETRTVGVNRNTDVGSNDTLNVGKELYIEAGSKITLKVGTSTVVIDPTSITLKAMSIASKAEMNLETSSKGMAQHTSDGPMVIRGAIININ